MSLARFAFQPCSFNHSDIFPFEINDLRAAATVVSGELCQTPCQRRAMTYAGNDTHRVSTPHRFGGQYGFLNACYWNPIELKWMHEDDN